jgi:TetR/AcrR family transcriptional regulator, cholesterol catabolism regulator
MKKMNPSMMFDLAKYHREAWQGWLSYKTKVIKQKVVNTLARGIREGYFRPDINIDVLATFRVEQVEMAFNDSIFPQDKFRFDEVQMQLFEHFIYGCLTRKGIDFYEETKPKFFELEPTPILLK